MRQMTNKPELWNRKSYKKIFKFNKIILLFNKTGFNCQNQKKNNKQTSKNTAGKNTPIGINEDMNEGDDNEDSDDVGNNEWIINENNLTTKQK